MDGKEGHLLSTGDLCSLNSLEALREAGVDSFKIEGRLKRPEYVSVVTSAYRFAIDHPLKLGRGPQNDLVFSAETAGVSGAHCVLTPVAEGVEIKDLGSSYGTILGNGTKLAKDQTAILKEGDTFCLGGQKQMFKIEKKEI
jgi:collagenase-like PrtC family protease